MFLATDSTKNGRYEFGDDECSPCVLRSKVCSINLKVAHEGGVGNTTVSVAGVLFRDGTELGGGGVLLGKDGTGVGDDLLLAVKSHMGEESTRWQRLATSKKKKWNRNHSVMIQSLFLRGSCG